MFTDFPYSRDLVHSTTLKGPIYRFLNSRYLPRAGEPTRLLLRSIAYYSHLKTIFGDDRQGDRLEGMSQLTFTETVDAASIPPEILAQGLVKSDVPLRPGMLTYVHDGSGRATPLVTYVHPHALVFCCAHGDLAELGPEFAKWGCDAALEIFDPAGLAEAIVEKAASDGIPVSNYLKEGRRGPVNYQEKEVDIAAGRSPPTGPFAKPKRYENQSEYRFVFDAVDHRLADHLLIDLRDIERFARIVLGPWGEAAEAPAFRFPQRDVRALVRQFTARTFDAGHHDLSIEDKALLTSLLWQARIEQGMHTRSVSAYGGATISRDAYRLDSALADEPSNTEWWRGIGWKSLGG